MSRKSKSVLKCVSIPVNSYQDESQDGRVPCNKLVHSEVGWSLQELEPSWELNAGVCCWQARYLNGSNWITLSKQEATFWGHGIASILATISQAMVIVSVHYHQNWAREYFFLSPLCKSRTTFSWWPRSITLAKMDSLAGPFKRLLCQHWQKLADIN